MPYLGYVKLNLKSPQIATFDEDVLMLVLADNRYGDRMSIQVGTSALGRAIQLITKEELFRASEVGKQIYVSTVLSHSNKAEIKIVTVNFL